MARYDGLADRYDERIGAQPGTPRLLRSRRPPRRGQEAARVPKPGGSVVVVTSHPCFVGPSVRAADGSRTALPGYRAGGARLRARDRRGIRGRVGTRHVPLAELLNGVARAGLVLTHVVKSGNERLPTLLGLRAGRPAG